MENSPKTNPFVEFLCGMIGLGLAMLIFLLMASCSPRIVYRDVEKTIYKDSLVYVDTTILVPYPVEVIQTTTLSDSSYLQTSLAESSAWVDSLGLHHSLANKSGSFDVSLKLPSRWIISEAYKEKAETLIRYETKPLSKWQSFRLGAFPWLLGIILSLGVVVFRKPLGKLMKLIAKRFAL